MIYILVSVISIVLQFHVMQFFYSNIVCMKRKDTNFFKIESQSKKADSRQHRIAKEMCTKMHTGDFYL